MIGRAGSLMLLSLTVVACAAPFPIYDGVTADPPEAGPLEDLSFLAGCWRGVMPDGTVAEENFSMPGGAVMLGNSRMLSNGRTVSWEFSRITIDEGDVVLRVYPGGELSEADFRLTGVIPEAQVTFADPDHDFPKRIRYQMIQPSLMQITIDGGEGSDRLNSWNVAQAVCIPGR